VTVANRGDRVWPLLALVLACACSSDVEANDSGDTPDAAVAQDGAVAHCGNEMEERCLDSQRICVVDEGAERCEACPAGQHAATAAMCADIPGSMLEHDFGTYALEPGQEVNSLCQSWTVGNETDLWVNAVELTNSGGYHHSNWLFVPDDVYGGPDGAWPCRDREYDELGAAVAGGVLYAQSTQARREVQKFPTGVAVRLPPHVRIIGGNHLLNTTGDATESDLRLRIYTIDPDAVTVPLAPFRLSYYGLTIPPQAVSEFTGECDLSEASPGSETGDLDMELYYALPHYHALGHSFRLEIFGGPRDGELLFEIGAFDSEAHGRAFDPPLDLHGANGFRFTCGFENPRSAEVGWGIDDQEMCVMLGFARSDYIFDASVATGSEVEAAGSTRQFSGSCGAIALEFERGKGP
jgi:hypothetical protein